MSLLRCYQATNDVWRSAQRLQFRHQSRLCTPLLSRFIINCGFWPCKITFKVSQKFFTCLVFYRLMKNLYIFNLYVKNCSLKEPDVFKRRSAADMLHIYLRRNVNYSVEYSSKQNMIKLKIGDFLEIIFCWNLPWFIVVKKQFPTISIQTCDFGRVEPTLLHGKTFLEKFLWVTASVYMEANTTDASQHSLVQS